MLTPQSNQFRAVIDLGGYWRFSPDYTRRGHAEEWFNHGLPDGAMTIAVPGAWNEQLAERGIMNFVGLGWYETELTVPASATHNQRIWIHFGAADHRAEVWLNGQYVGCHEGGYLPFQFDVTTAWKHSALNHLVVAVDSKLTMTSLPQDVDPSTPPYDKGYERRHVYPPTRFDYFPYGGLARTVSLLTTPKDMISNIIVRASLDGTVMVHVDADENHRVCVRIADGKKIISSASGVPGLIQLQLSEVRAWCPADPHLYTAQVRLLDNSSFEIDGYDQEFGVREVRIEGDRVLLNNEPLYLLGFGKHEDVPIVGRGQFRPALIRDFELMRWIGANSLRTSHYPYDEEVMQLADRFGFLIIGEVPAVSLGFWSDRFEVLAPLLENHKRAMTELVDRDKNHPSVISWSIVNEPNLWSEPHYQNDASRRYFKAVYDHVKRHDKSRPVLAITIPAFSENDVALESCDIVGINRYYAWYTDPSEIEKAAAELETELERIHTKHGKPIVLTEFGADTIEGLHATTPQLFTEEFQTVFLKTYCNVADQKTFCAGTHIWNFADFLTPQNFRRVFLNKKGIFTRSRQPKAAAFAIRELWRKHARVFARHRVQGTTDEFLVPDAHQSLPRKSR